MTLVAVAIISSIVLSGALGAFLLMRQAAAVAAHRETVPAGFAGEISLEEHQRAAAYASARAKVGIVKTVFDTVLAALWLTVLLAPLYGLIAQFTGPGILRSVAVVVAFALIERLIRLPFSIFSTFWLEARFGLNRTSPLMFAADRIKGLTLSGALGVPLLFGLFWLPRALPLWWWLAAWAGFVALAIAMSMIFPLFVHPLFNKFTALPNGPLKDRIEALLGKCGFASKGLFVIDASRRSTHGNAYFSGLGNAKRIVLFDTLLQNHTDDEILSILAHELGHYRLGHIGQRILEMAAFAFAGFAVLGVAFEHASFIGAFGLPADPGLVLIAVLFTLSPFLHLLSPLTSYLSRRAEFEADHFAQEMTGPSPMISALMRLARENLSTLTPDALYALFYYSHPPVPARIARLKSA
jgi:STE24 endopeptidase